MSPPRRKFLPTAVPCLALVFASIFVSACSSLMPDPDAGSAADSRPEATVAVAAGRAAEPAGPALPPPPKRSVALLHSGTANDVVDEIASRLAAASWSVNRIPASAFADAMPPDAVTSDAAAPGAAVPGAAGNVAAVAVGLEAATIAADRLAGLPIVFCEVFDYRPLLDGRAPAVGISALPPARMLLRAWKSAHASLARIGVIVSDAHADLADDLVAAAQTLGVEVVVARSASDRETLYLFRRMAAGIDGFWLLPDPGILSPDVMRELLAYAVSHDVGVLSFNEALLGWGAMLAARSSPGDVATHVVAALDRVVSGDENVPGRVLPLGEARLHFNADIAQRLGLTNVPASGWVLHEPD